MGWFSSNDGFAGRFQPTMFRLHPAAVLAAALLAPLHVQAVETPAGPTGMQTLSEEELRRVAAQGLADRLLQRIALYAANGVGIEVLGDMASLLNPLTGPFVGLVDAETTFRDAVFNPHNPSMLVDKDGSALVRLPDTIGEINVRNLRVHGSNGTTFGSVSIRDVDFTGTTVRVTRR